MDNRGTREIPNANQEITKMLKNLKYYEQERRAVRIRKGFREGTRHDTADVLYPEFGREAWLAMKRKENAKKRRPHGLAEGLDMILNEWIGAPDDDIPA